MTCKYEGFDRMPIGRQRRAGRSGKTLTDHDPSTGKVVAEVPQADLRDVDDAYGAAQLAQLDWRHTGPEHRAAVMRKAAEIMVTRHDEIADWVIRESGGTVSKVDIELGVVRAGFLEAAGMPHHLEGRIMPSDIPGKENRIYRRPVGVVCLISPWDFPMYLTRACPADRFGWGL